MMAFLLSELFKECPKKYLACLNKNWITKVNVYCLENSSEPFQTLFECLTEIWFSVLFCILHFETNDLDLGNTNVTRVSTKTDIFSNVSSVTKNFELI